MAPLRDTYNHGALGASLNTQIKQSRVLLVGAGGIGCELLKTLVLTGFGEIHIIDLDTIDLSNLNRQFLFRHEHIKKPKALVAKDAAQRFNPSVKLVAHHANIKDAQFGVDYFAGFQIAFNALDNLEARRHVNRMCLAADVPLIESGTTGFNGQVQVIKKGVTACYDCSPKEAPKTFPVCTIRSTPSQPIHCIVWAKSYLLNEMFGDSEDESAFDHSADAQNSGEIAELQKEAKALKAIRQAVGTPDFPRLLFDKVFHSDMTRLQSMEDMWKSRRPPASLVYETALAKATKKMGVSTEDDISQIVAKWNGQKVWSLGGNVLLFRDSLARLSRRILDLKQQQPQQTPTIDFDKDDIDTLDFVTASANIRSTLFGIDCKSRFDIKQMAGNIIPAIATTNAIVAGLCVLQSFKVLKGDFGLAREVFLTPFAPTHLLAADASRKPNPECPVCSSYQTRAYLDLSTATLRDVVEGFIQKKLGFGDRDFSLNSDIGFLYDPDELENLDKKLVDLDVQPGSFLTVIDDEDDEPFVNISISLQQSVGPSYEDAEAIPGIPKQKRKVTIGTGKDNDNHADTGVEELPAKRPRGDDEGVQPRAKRAKVTGGTEEKSDGSTSIEENEVLFIDDDPSSGAILIDD